MDMWPEKEKLEIHLSTDQWNDLVKTIDEIDRDNLTDSARNELDASISKYLLKSFEDQEAISPSARSAIYDEMARLSNDLLLIIEKYFFPINPENREWWYDEVVRRQQSRTKAQPDELLFEPELKGNAPATGATCAQRNEFTRRVLLGHIGHTSIVDQGVELDMELIHAGISKTHSLSKAASERSQAKKGRPAADPHLHQLVADSLKVYKSLGGVGFTVDGDAPPFMERLMKYVIEFAHDKLGEDYARNLRHSVQGTQLTEKIKQARKQRDYLY